jgi:hypothetical protein
MKAEKITIQNFRSFGPEPTTIRLSDGLTGLIGANSSGKTAVMAAFTRMFGLTNFDRTFTKSDFHAPVVGQGEERQIESSLSIEVIFSFADGEDGIPDLFEDMTVKEEGADPILRVRLLADWTDDGISPDGNIDTRMVQVSVPPGEAEDGTSTTPFAAKKRALIQAFYVPAIRKPSEQMKFSAGAILHRLYRRMERPTNFDDEFEALIDQVDAKANDIPKFRLIQETLAEEWKRYNRDAKYNNARIAFASQDFESFLRKLEVEFSPTDINRPYGIRELGEGYRSLFYLTLVSTLLKIEAEEEPADTDITVQPYLTILLTEEPENHVSPQLLGVVLTNLKDLSTLDNAQVVISSHTPAILKRIDPENIRHLRIDATEHRSIVKEIALPEKESDAFKYIKEAVRNYPELYFAKLAILGEGDSEEVVFSALARAYGTDFDSHYITVAPLGGRFVNHVWRLLENLGIPYVTLLDLDRERGKGGWERVKYGIDQLIKHQPETKAKLLTVEGGVLSDEDLGKMNEWDILQVDTMAGWIKMLEGFDLFLSSPLDLDFMMYESFTEAYQETAPKNGGPQIPVLGDDPEEYAARYQKKLQTGIQATLKNKNATAATYSDEQKAAMIWYNYLFLGRGKPSTHITAMAKLTPPELKANAPAVLLRMFDRIEAIINQG